MTTMNTVCHMHVKLYIKTNNFLPSSILYSLVAIETSHFLPKITVGHFTEFLPVPVLSFKLSFLSWYLKTAVISTLILS